MVQDDIGDEEMYVEDTEDGQKVFGLNAEDQYDHIFRVLQEYGYTEEQLASMEGVVEFITGDNRGRVLGQVFDLDASTGHRVPAKTEQCKKKGLLRLLFLKYLVFWE